MLGIDDLHNAHLQVKHAEELAAAAFGAERTKFLVGGTTVGNQAMLMSCLGPGDVVLAPHGCHRSFLSGLLLSGAALRSFPTSYCAELDCFLPPSLTQVLQALEDHPQARALFLTNPTYHGACCSLPEIVEAAHRREVLVLVDEAWGAHLAFCPELPASAVAAGADMVVQSLHKMAPALTPGALLHYRPRSVDCRRVDSVLRHLQTSSPSSLLVASMDCARRRLSLDGEQPWRRVVALSRHLQQRVRGLDGWICPSKEPPQWDPTRVSLGATELGYSGHQLAAWLRQKGVQVEMSEAAGVLLLLLPGHSEKEVQSLGELLQTLTPRTPDQKLQHLRSLSRAHGHHLSAVKPEHRITVREAFHARSTTVPIREAVDRICSDSIYCYPPGVALVYPGQRLDRSLLDLLETHLSLGGSVQGGVDPVTGTVSVLEEPL